MRTANELKQFIYNKLLSARNVFTTLVDDDFIEAYKKASLAQQDQFWALATDGDKNGIARLKRKLLREELASFTVRELRRVAQSYGIHGYNSLPKASLLSAIVQREETNEENQRDLESDGILHFEI